MTIQWTGFPSAVDATSSDILVGLSGGTANARFNATSFLFKANNLSDVESASTAFNNISPLTTKGDLLWFNGSSSNARIAIGSINQIFAVGASNTPGWINNPGLLTANNLSDLESLSTALTNLGLASNSNVTFATVTTTGLNVNSHAAALTAHSGGGQGSALALTAAINQVTTVAAANDSVKLPIAAAGISVVVINAAASNSLNCFPNTGDAINALGANTAFAVAAGKTVQFFCSVNGTWNSILSA